MVINKTAAKVIMLTTILMAPLAHPTFSSRIVYLMLSGYLQPYSEREKKQFQT